MTVARSGMGGGRLRRLLTRGFLLGVSLAAGVTGMSLTATLFNRRGWCCLHSWGQMHGTWLLVFLPCARLTFHVGRLIGARLGLLEALTWRTWALTAGLVLGPLVIVLSMLRAFYGVPRP